MHKVMAFDCDTEKGKRVSSRIMVGQIRQDGQKIENVSRQSLRNVGGKPWKHMRRMFVQCVIHSNNFFEEQQNLHVR